MNEKLLMRQATLLARDGSCYSSVRRELCFVPRNITVFLIRPRWYWLVCNQVPCWPRLKWLARVCSGRDNRGLVGNIMRLRCRKSWLLAALTIRKLCPSSLAPAIWCWTFAIILYKPSKVVWYAQESFHLFGIFGSAIPTPLWFCSGICQLYICQPAK